MATYWQATMRYYRRDHRPIGEDRLVYAWLREDASEEEVRGVQSRAIWIEAPQGAESAKAITEMYQDC
jgi:sirohydrochlorin ferrochelatase